MKWAWEPLINTHNASCLAVSRWTNTVIAEGVVMSLTAPLLSSSAHMGSYSSSPRYLPCRLAITVMPEALSASSACPISATESFMWGMGSAAKNPNLPGCALVTFAPYSFTCVEDKDVFFKIYE